MANYFLCLVVQRLVLPLILATCVLMRPVGLAIPYLIFLLAIPYVPVANKKTILGPTGLFMRLLILCGIIDLAVMIVFQLILIGFPGSSIESCSLGEIILRHIGLVSFNNLDAWMVVYWLAPDVILIFFGFVIYFVLRKLTGVIVPRRRRGVDATNARDDTEQGTVSSVQESTTADADESEPQTSLISPERLPFFTKLGVLLSMCMLCVVGIIQPSALSGVYYIVFLGAASWWACYKKLDRAFGIVLKITLVVLVIHIVLFLSYQNPWPQEVLYFNDTTARVLGLKPILNSSCNLANGTDIRNVYFNSDFDTDVYLNPIFLLICYYTLTMTSSLLLRTRSDVTKDRKRMDLSSQLENGIRLQNQISFRMQRKNILRKTLTSDRWRGAARKVKLMRRGTHRIRDASANDGKEGAQTDQIALETLATNKTISEEEEPSSFFEQALLAIRNVATYIYKNSYIFTNVIMMVWSIMYHSWLTFVLLLWANAIWILPNHRRNMLNSSPFLVIYAELLLLAQFLYGMNLTEAELPTVVEGSGINLEQVGFVRRTEYPCVPLLVKSLFTTMFWISLRQRIQEKQTERRESMIANMAAPLQLPVGAATTAATGPSSATEHPPEKKSSAIVDKMAKFLRSLMIKFWIWVVALTLFLSAIIGNRMTVFRIVYMVLFLCFVLTFQFSFRVWRRVMFTFWLTVIMYSMAILILVYLHQFEQFPGYWAAIGISKELQEDIGLEIFKTGQLFLHLVNPTLVVIITVIQLHYCHDRFLIISEIPTIQTEDQSDDEEKQEPATPVTDGPAYGTFTNAETIVIDDSAEPAAQTTATSEEQIHPKPSMSTDAQPVREKVIDEDDDDQSEKIEDFRFRKLSRQEITGFARKAWKQSLQLLELTWLFFEIHMLKIVLIVAFSLSVNSVNFLHLLYVVLSVFTVKAHTTGKDSLMYVQLIRITRIMSLFSAIMLILTMIYQVKYIKEENFQSECPNIDGNTTQMDMNNAKWFGMRKTGSGETLSDLLRPYLVYILIVTVHTVTILRQTIHRIRLGQSPKTPSLMFPNIVRADADKDIPRMIQYLFNYGYYKFGVEISLVTLIVVIGNRMDVFSIFYAIWLAIMFHMTREGLQRLWKPLTWFIVVIIPIQYVLFIGLPPLACVNYPWFIPQLDHFRIWAMLPENTNEFRSFANKMVSDFVLLMFLCRQTVVFRLETNPTRGFGGGSNTSVLEDFKKLDEGTLQNPTPDFITKVRNWLDMLKRTLFLVSFWFTLAVVFLSGSSRVNLFSIGYLIGAFFFLWQGTDFYLHSIEYILKRWNILICYNVFVIGAKAFLQLFGCLFLENLVNNNCWVMQLLGMNCLSSTLPPLPPGTVDPGEQCNIPHPSDAGLFWDGMCFAFLLLQRRLFSSHYFCHIINESKASKYLASRGAELIEELRIKESAQEAERERQILEKIKAKMDRIKATQQKILEAVQDPATHAIDTVDHRSSLKRKISEHRPTAIRSGDYYMFEEVEQEFELDLMEPHEYEDDLEEKSQKDQRLRQRLTLGRLAAQLRKQRQKEVYELAYGDRTDTDDSNEVDQPPTLASSDLPGEDQAHPPLRRRLSSPIVLRRRQLGMAARDDHTALPERSALSEPLPPHDSAHSATRQRKPTALDAPTVETGGPSRELHPQQSITDEEARLLSDDEDEVEGRKEAAPEEKKSKFSLSGLALIPAFLAGAVGSVTLRLHRASRNYRYVMRVLTREKQVLKETPGFGVGVRDKDGVWTHCVSRTGSSTSPQPEGTAHSGSAQSGSSSSSLLSRPGSLASISRFNSSNVNDNTDYERDYAEAEQPASAVPSSPAVTFTVSEVQPDTASESEAKPNTIRDLQEYCTERQHGDEGLHTVSGLGAALAMIGRKDPLREDKTDGSSTEAVKRTLDEVSSEEDFSSRKHSIIFELLQAAWYAIMSHTDFICYFVVFLNQVNSASLLSLPLPLMVTLWGTLTFPRPAQTFWTMLIAYTQMVVLVKCIGQFEMFWWNQTPIPSNQPFHVARLFGIERKDGYATYDLMLLLMLYCHRFILKSLGLWKSDPTDDPALTEGIYQVDTNDDRTKALMALAEENEKKRETLEIRPPDELTGLSMVKINEKDGTIVEEPTGEEDPNVLCVTIHSEPTKKYFPQIAKQAFLRYSAALKAFFAQLFDRTSRKTTDVYGYMFLCDFINFFVILFGFSSFGSQDGDGGVLSYFEENRVPVTFLLMLLIQFFLIVVDRALYLRKHILGKIVFQFILIIGLHVWMFFVLPATTERSFNATTPPIVYYMIKCFYLLFSAYQIRCGYPARILGNFLTKGFTMANFSGFKLFMTVPFLFELRTLMDWIWTDTSMTLFDWLKMEDIFSNVYQLKCMRQLEEDLPAPRGQKKGAMVKYLMGGGMMLGIIFLIWFPLALFAFSNAVGQPNIPHDVSVELRIGTYEPVYAMSAQNNSIYGLTPNNWSNFTAPFMERAAQTFLSNYEPADVAAVQLGINSTSIWNISPPERNRLLNDLINNVTLTCRFRYTISRMTNSKENPGVISEERTYQLDDGPARQALINSITREKDNDMAALMNIMPKFLRVQNSGAIRPVHQLVKSANNDEADENYRNMQIRQLYMDEKSNVSWWEATEDCGDTLYEKYFSRLPFADCANYLVIYMFNDKIFPSTISSIAAGGIIGIYSTMILVFSRMLRTSIFSGASSKIMFEDLPYVDRVLQLCLDIYLVRESSEFTLEEDLFAKLLFLYRSPETMIKWTRPKNEGGGDDETDTMTDQPASHPKQE
ncbi:piezo-type mechanosensitive ion channel component isoform X1 [Anopheles funestus]|uniref:piezo-type mechanosensitive ion channel component isoform X1 n=1 Tax=Anopheles funestus TaxID=62324 RepID=UPI0020C70796|nr:piezo-type mechanosensitive ion channel component isoform X1 [Anopheles funestus]XP_049282306.1 piezo-type mechanosensitive ion channel component isoform X1 [Anopheles funestus]XP_049282307.1 piezo-type mechanosensitive ion channel component isoform X1 [Anopheles funestus]XP_049282308.1 piezo-type mechanosensitive ion channel component isoform X1 [Anopheles funestus]XP_049282309.1 piezo-type mechanosensitive ion channel component isoform X1 [Anopheles funestus]XP_049282310.1 piezo-type mech